MAPREIYDAVHTQPFEPFRLVATDGAASDVTHPDLCIVGLRLTLLLNPAREDPQLFERTIRIDILHIIGMEPLGTTA